MFSHQRNIGGRTRSFQFSWIEKCNGLVYSEKHCGANCKYCVLFPELHKLHNNQIWRSGCSPLNQLKKTPGKTGKLHSHFSTSQYQARAVEFADEFLQTTSKKAKLVDQHINSSRAKQVKENQRKLASIASAILMCGWQWIDLRSHQDDSSDVANDLDRNHGNFLALLQYRACGGNSILDEHFNSCAGNVIYTSKTIQNELIMICSHLIRGLILEEVREAWFYIVIADEQLV